ncbi:lytic transglycosylase domain-containing protein [Desulfuromonas thiophila]|uniref:lytic transglycosylase domain-containing protein n=1 Tax=Desulfuromonas thiophila TaxID=57664 RepID=UPI0024A85347|nr:lytic transglycosylase domain-containing protein [Desulfuromonas thiophila]
MRLTEMTQSGQAPQQRVMAGQIRGTGDFAALFASAVQGDASATLADMAPLMLASSRQVFAVGSPEVCESASLAWQAGLAHYRAATVEPQSERSASLAGALRQMEQQRQQGTVTGAEKGAVLELAERAAARYDLNPALVKAVIQAESGFNVRAQSHAGAQGLMQLMPGTARDLGVSDPFEAEQNVMGGARYLRQLLDRFEGNLDRALAAYNWGMGNVERKGLARMPQETRTYLARVKQYQAEFV